MRIGLVVNHLGVGGAERQAALWAEQCAALGHEPAVVVLDPLERSYELPAGVRVHELGKSRRADLPRVARRLRAIVREQDLVIAFQTFPALCSALAVRAAGARPWIVVAGNDPRRWRDTSRVPAPVLRWAFRQATLGCAPTGGIARCHESLGVRPRRGWRVVPNIVDRRAFAANGNDARKSGVLFVGRLAAVKNPQLAADAALSARAPLTIAGEGSLEDALKRSLAGRDAGAPLQLRGFVEEPWDLYSDHRVLLVTSRYESFGNMIVESLAAGTPVVSVDCDYGPRELIDGARFSHLSEPDPARLGALLREVLERPYTEAEREECLGIASRYRPETIAPAIAGVIDEVRR
jgi:glycosyltransferase involved in cell wall biosynthesis